jgi:hypothetical protein
VLFATAAGKHYGWEEYEFKQAYEVMQQAVFEDSAMSDPLLELVLKLMLSLPADSRGFDGSPSELLAHLTAYAAAYEEELLRRKDWVKGPGPLVKRLLAGRSGLLQLGIDVTVTRDSDNKSRVKLTYVGERPPMSDVPF